MKSDFEKLLSNCQSRVDKDKVKVIKVSRGEVLHVNSQDGGVSSREEIRPAVKDIIHQKMRETEKAQNSAKILFSLKDFQEKKEVEESASEEDEVKDDELNEDDESVRDVSFDEEVSEETISSDIEEIKVEERKVESKPSSGEADLESEIIKLENLQRKVSESFQDVATQNSKSGTVLLKMNDPVGKVKELLKGQSRPGVSISKEPSKMDKKTDDDLKKEEVIDIEDSKEEEVVVMADSRKKTLPTINPAAFKNISISVVGSGGNPGRNINIQNLFSSKPGTSSVSSNTSGKSKGFTGPNISLKRKSTDAPPSFDNKRFKSSAIVITSPQKSTLNERDNGDDDEPSENLATNYDNCTHGDPLGYICLDCIYLRWKTGFDFVKTRKEKPKTVEEPVKEVEEVSPSADTIESDEAAEAPANILKSVNWEQVFNFAGISVGQRHA